MVRRSLASALTTLVATVLVAGGLTACDFDGAYDLPLPGSPVDADEAYEVTADFDDILNVVPRSPVFVDDVTVGEVIEVDRVGWHARVTLRIRDDVVLPNNAVAEIRQVSLLGEKYVALEPPTGEAPQGQLGEGDNIALDRTGRNPEVEEVLAALSTLLSGGGVAQLGTITEELNNVMSGRTDELRGLLGTLDRVVSDLDDQKLDIIRALQSLNNLSQTLNEEKDTIQGALDVVGPAVDVLDDQTDELVTMLASLDRLGTVGTRVIRASKDDLLAQLRDLEPVLDNLSDAGDSLAPGLNLLVSFPFPKEASEIVRGDYANTSIRADINLENFFSPGLPDLPLPDLPDLPDLPLPEIPGLPNVNLVLKCLTSGGIDSKACRKVLRSADLLPRLVKQCAKPKNRRNGICLALGLLDGVGGLLPGLTEGLSGGLGSLGLGRYGAGLASGDPSPPADTTSLLGGAS
jgi:phospholipid/cholesterol/gamma-HCH transport system substrate-binding protein